MEISEEVLKLKMGVKADGQRVKRQRKMEGFMKGAQKAR